MQPEQDQCCLRRIFNKSVERIPHVSQWVVIGWWNMLAPLFLEFITSPDKSEPVHITKGFPRVRGSRSPTGIGPISGGALSWALQLQARSGWPLAE